MSRHTVSTIEELTLDTPLFHRVHVRDEPSEEVYREFLRFVSLYEKAGGRAEEVDFLQGVDGKQHVKMEAQIFMDIETAFRAGESPREVSDMVEYTYPDLTGRSLAGGVGESPHARLVERLRHLCEELGKIEPPVFDEEFINPDILFDTLAHELDLVKIALRVPEFREHPGVREIGRRYAHVGDVIRGLLLDLEGKELQKAFRNIIREGLDGQKAAAQVLGGPEAYRLEGVLEREDLLPLLRSGRESVRQQALRFLSRTKERPDQPNSRTR